MGLQRGGRREWKGEGTDSLRRDACNIRASSASVDRRQVNEGGEAARSSKTRGEDHGNLARQREGERGSARQRATGRGGFSMRGRVAGGGIRRKRDLPLSSCASGASEHRERSPIASRPFGIARGRCGAPCIVSRRVDETDVASSGDWAVCVGGGEGGERRATRGSAGGYDPASLSPWHDALGEKGGE